MAKDNKKEDRCNVSGVEGNPDTRAELNTDPQIILAQRNNIAQETLKFINDLYDLCKIVNDAEHRYVNTGTLTASDYCPDNYLPTGENTNIEI